MTPHIDPERLALFALGEPGVTAAESEHLAGCAVCVDEFGALRHAAIAGRATLSVGELETPPEIVWQRIVAELALGDSPPPGAPSRGSRRRMAWRGWALAASFALIAALGLGGWALTQRLAPSGVAEASLAAFPGHPDAAGTAIVEEGPDGQLELRVQLAADEAPDTFREVWLITADASALVSLGVLEGREQTFPIPTGVDLRDYVLVDVSQEPADGDPEHSGDSIVRGELTFL